MSTRPNIPFKSCPLRTIFFTGSLRKQHLSINLKDGGCAQSLRRGLQVDMGIMKGNIWCNKIDLKYNVPLRLDFKPSVPWVAIQVVTALIIAK